MYTKCYCMVSQLAGIDRWQKQTPLFQIPPTLLYSESGRAGVPSVNQFFANILPPLADDNLLRISNPKIWLREDFISLYDLGRRALSKASTTLILHWAVKASQLWPLSSDSSVSKHPWWDVWWYMWFKQQNLTERAWERERGGGVHCRTLWDEHITECFLSVSYVRLKCAKFKHIKFKSAMWCMQCLNYRIVNFYYNF